MAAFRVANGSAGVQIGGVQRGVWSCRAHPAQLEEVEPGEFVAKVQCRVASCFHLQPFMSIPLRTTLGDYSVLLSLITRGFGLFW